MSPCDPAADLVGSILYFVAVSAFVGVALWAFVEITRDAVHHWRCAGGRAGRA